MSEVVEAPPVAPPVASTAPVAPPVAKAPDGKPADAKDGAKPEGDARPDPKPEPKWSETWREDMAGSLPETATDEELAEHDKLLKRLKRFSSPADAAKAIREHDKLIASGALKKQLPKSATPEQVAEWRKENGIPEKPDGYDLGIPKDAELSDRDTEFLAEWAAQAHGVNASPEVVRAGVQSFLSLREKLVDQMHQANAEAKKAAEDELRSEWGHDYRANVDGIDSLLRHAGGEVQQALLGARMADGVQLMNHPAVARWLSSHARELGFVGATVVPSGGDVGKTIDAELESIYALMDSDPKKYRSAQVQQRLHELTTAKLKREKV